MTAAVVGEDLDFTWKHTFRRGKRLPEVCIVSVPFGRFVLLPSISRRQLPVAFLNWLEKKKVGQRSLPFFTQQILKPSHLLHPYCDLCYQRVTDDLRFVVKCKHFLAFSTAECSLKNASVRTSPLIT